MNFLQKLQNQPLYIRKIIFWAVIIVIGLVLLALLVKNTQKNLSNLQPAGVNLPSFEGLKELPQINETE